MGVNLKSPSEHDLYNCTGRENAMTRPHSKATTRERTYTDDRSRRRPPTCRRCGQAGSVHGGGNDPDALVNGLCWDCRQDVNAGGPDGVDVESLIDGMDQ